MVGGLGGVGGRGEAGRPVRKILQYLRRKMVVVMTRRLLVKEGSSGLIFKSILKAHSIGFSNGIEFERKDRNQD